MWPDGRRRLLVPSFALWRRAFASIVAERDALKRELTWTQEALIELRGELRAAVLARHRAEAELAALYRERAI